MIIGGKAGNYLNSLETAILFNNNVLWHGAVAVLLENIPFKADYIFGWRELGHEYVITTAKGNRVFTINHMPTAQFYKKYLGDHVYETLPFSGIEYPLVFRQDGIPIARACINKHEDDSLSFAGKIPEGTRVRLACASLEDRDSQLKKASRAVSTSEFTLIFSCIARKTFLGDLIVEELREIKIPNIGFFTYGEYFSSYLLNETSTIVEIGRRTEEQKLYSTTNLIKELSKEYDNLKEAIDNSGFGLLILNEISGKKFALMLQNP